MPRQLLTRSRAVSAGATIVSELGYSSLNPKAVARRAHATVAGVQRQMSCTELTDDGVAKIMASAPRVPSEGNWSGRLRPWAVETRDWLSDHPGLAGHLMERGWGTPASRDLLAEVLAVFESTDLAPAQCVMTGITLLWFVLSSADMDGGARALGGHSRLGKPDPQQHRPLSRGPVGEYTADTGAMQFTFGLDLLIEGIERRFGEGHAEFASLPTPRRHPTRDPSSDRVLRN